MRSMRDWATRGGCHTVPISSFHFSPRNGTSFLRHLPAAATNMVPLRPTPMVLPLGPRPFSQAPSQSLAPVPFGAQLEHSGQETSCGECVRVDWHGTL